jgi:hypothetical protein
MPQCAAALAVQNSAKGLGSGAGAADASSCPGDKVSMFEAKVRAWPWPLRTT